MTDGVEKSGKILTKVNRRRIVVSVNELMNIKHTALMKIAEDGVIGPTITPLMQCLD